MPESQLYLSRTIPRIKPTSSKGPVFTTQIRNVAVEDLLGRRPVNLDESAVRRKVDGRVVLITGAAGSIGSESCASPVARFQPERIVALDISETGLFHVESGDARSVSRRAISCGDRQYTKFCNASTS